MCTFRSDTTKIKTKKLGKKKKIEKKERVKIKEIKKEDSRLSELYSRFFTFIYHYCCFEHKQVILAFIFVFIVYRIVSYILERLFKPSGTGMNVLKSQVYTLIRLYLLTGDIFDKLRQRHSIIRT